MKLKSTQNPSKSTHLDSKFTQKEDVQLSPDLTGNPVENGLHTSDIDVIKEKLNSSSQEVGGLKVQWACLHATTGNVCSTCVARLLSQSSTHLLSELIEEIEGMKKPVSTTTYGVLGDAMNSQHNKTLSDVQTLLKKKLNQQ